MKEKVIALAKDKGLDLAEDAAKDLCELAFEVMELVVEESENKIDDAVFGSLKGLVKEFIDEKIDLIDGEEG